MQRETLRVFGFMALVCLGCSIVVSGAAVGLKARQEANAKLDMQKNVLLAAGFDTAAMSPADIKAEWDKVTAVVVDLETGRQVEGVEVTDIDLSADSKDPGKNIELTSDTARLAQVRAIPKRVPVYKVQREGKKLIVLPIWGKGLWSTLWGFIALEKDTNTVAGLTYYQHGETPGLGGEVDNPRWKKLWPGRKVFETTDGGKIATPEAGLPVVALEVKKGAAGPVEKDPHAVDGLSGATITSRGVSHMLALWLGDDGYGQYLANYRAGKAGPKKAKKKAGKSSKKSNAPKKSE